MYARVASFIPALAIAAAVACGGGGSKTGSTSSNQPSAVTQVAATLQASAPASAAAAAPSAVPTLTAGASMVPTTQAGAAAAVTTATAPVVARSATAASTVPAVAAATDAFNPCSLLKKQEVTAALGEDFEDGKSLIAPDSPSGVPGVVLKASACEFISTTNRYSVTLLVYRTSGAASAQVRQIFDQIICQKNERIADLGDLACWYNAQHEEVHVMKGTTFLSLTVPMGFGKDATQQAIPLARQAAGRLP